MDSIYGCPYIDPSLHPWDEAYLIMVDDHFDVFLDSVDKWMELENIILSEVTQSQKNTHGMHSLISGY